VVVVVAACWAASALRLTAICAAIVTESDCILILIVLTQFY
jgi:hypothetical protein